MSEVNTTPAGFSVGVNLDAAPAAPQGNNEFVSSLPAEYSAKEWAVNLSKHENPIAEMAKQFDNQLSLIGRKAEGIKLPGEGATPEDWSNFHKSIGVPDSPDKYDYQAPQVKEELKNYFQADENLLNLMKQAAIKAGVRPEGFKHLAEAFDNYYLSELEKNVVGTNELLGKLENNFKAKYGEKSNQVLETWQQSISGLGKEQTAVIDALDPRVKVVLAEQYETFAKKYIREDNLNLNVPTSGQAMSQKEYGDAYEQAFAKVRSATPGSAQHIAAQAELKALKERGAQIFKS